MADIEKVINGLKCRAYDNDFPCHQCAYFKQDCKKAIPRCDYRGLLDDAVKLLELLCKKSAQPEIVRCKDCKYLTEDNIYECGLRNFAIYSEDWFCADGERRSNT